MTTTPTPQRPDALVVLASDLADEAHAFRVLASDMRRSADVREAYTFCASELEKMAAQTTMTAAPAVAPASAVGDLRATMQEAINLIAALKEQRARFVLEAALAAPSDAQPELTAHEQGLQWAEQLKPKADAQPAQAVTDAMRLDYLNTSESYIAHSRDGDTCWLMVPDEDGFRTARAQFDSHREAIDAELAERARSAQSRSDNGAIVTDALVAVVQRSFQVTAPKRATPFARDIRAALEAYERARHSAQAVTDASAGNTAEAVAVKLLRDIRWKSADRDNMEFTATITYSQMDAIEAIRANAAKPVELPGKTQADAISIPREELERAIKALRYAAHPHPSPHADALAVYLAASLPGATAAADAKVTRVASASADHCEKCGAKLPFGGAHICPECTNKYHAALADQNTSAEGERSLIDVLKEHSDGGAVTSRSARLVVFDEVDGKIEGEE